MKLRSIATLVSLGIAAVVWTGCEGKKQTEFVAGISTQVRVPKDLKTIRVDVLVGGTQVKCDSYRVYDGKVQLPRTLGTLPIDDSNRGLPITITVAGYSEERLEASTVDQFADCVNTPISLGTEAAKGRVLRSSRQTYTPEKILFLPMPLSFACFDRTNCRTEETCKAGRCTAVDINSENLAEFREEMVNGAASTCFSIDRCVTLTGQSPFVLDADKCLYAHPGSDGAPSFPAPAPAIPKDGDGLNVRAFFDGGEVSEVLDLDEAEGYFIPDPAKPQQFQLAPGLCDMIKGVDPEGKALPHRISGLQSSGLCQSKTQRQPICDAELNKVLTGNEGGNVTPQAGTCQTFEVKSAPSALVVLLDGSVRMDDFYKDTTVTKTLGLSLADPVFESMQLGLKAIPQQVSCDTRVFPTLDVAMQPALKAQKAIASVIADFVSGKTPLEPIATPLKIDGALEAAYATLNGPAFATFSRKGVLVLGNRDFTSTKCTAAVPIAEVVKKGKIPTYALLLGSGEGEDNELVAAAKEIPDTVKLYDSRKDQARGADAFSQITRDLSSCLYGVPGGKTIDGKSTVSYYDPTRKETIRVLPSNNCTDAAGYTVDNGRIKFCPKACDQMVGVLKERSNLALALGSSAAAIPVFASTGCE